MLKKKYSLLTLASLALFSCNPMEDIYDKLDAAKEPLHEDVAYTMAASDYASMSKIALAKATTAADTTLAKLIASSNSFPNEELASSCIGSYLSTLFPALNKKSTATVTYNVNARTEEEVETIKQVSNAPLYLLTAADYESVWGETGIKYLTPEKSPKTTLPKILSTAYPDANEGQLVKVEYNFSTIEPEVDALVLNELNEDFEAGTDYENVALLGWTNYMETGKKAWVFKSYKNDRYAEFSSYKSNEQNIAWLITPYLELESMTEPVLTFSVGIRNYNANCLQVLVSEDYNGMDPTSATWKDITNNFCVDYQSGETVLAGGVDLSAYRDKRINIAFKYTGSGVEPLATTTCRIDNVKVADGTLIQQNVIAFEDFETAEKDQPLNVTGWQNIAETGPYTWTGKQFSNNGYAQFSANKAPGETIGWLISPEYDLTGEKEVRLAFDLKIGYYNADCLQVLVSEDYDGNPANLSTAHWTDLTDKFVWPKGPTSGYSSDWSLGGVVSLNAYADKKIRVAIKYVGDGANGKTTTYQIDNFELFTVDELTAAAAFSAQTTAASANGIQYVMYQFKGGNWSEKSDVVVVAPADYEAMGLTSAGFTEEAPATDFLPQFMAMNYPYAQSGTQMMVMYLVDNAITVEVYRQETGVWSAFSGVVAKTDQFINNGKEWAFDPTLTFDMEATDYQALVDAVAADPEKVIYLDEKYGSNTEWWYGANAKYSNISMLIASRKQYDAKDKGALKDKSEEECREIFHARLQEGIAKHVLPNKFPDAEAEVKGVQMYYIVRYATYSPRGTWQAKFMGTGKGTFEYVEDTQEEVN